MIGATQEYTGRALERGLPRDDMPRALYPIKERKPVERDWLLVATDPTAKHRIMIAEVQDAVCRHFTISHRDLVSESRRAGLVRARQTSIWLCYELTRRSVSYISRQHGGRDHTTGIHAINRITRVLREDPKFAEQINALRARLEVSHYGLV
jgi:hypothetical protein